MPIPQDKAHSKKIYDGDDIDFLYNLQPHGWSTCLVIYFQLTKIATLLEEKSYRDRRRDDFPFVQYKEFVKHMNL